MICRVCDSNECKEILDLGDQPWCNNFLKKEFLGTEEKYPLRLMYCCQCSTTQLNYTVKKEIMFSNHTYVSGTTKTLKEHFASTARYVTENFQPPSRCGSVLDIGSNDGTQLMEYKNLGWDVLGVESSKNIASMAEKLGVSTIPEFFNAELAKAILARRNDKKFDVINASGVFFHLEELHSVCRGIKTLLDKRGVFVVQFIYMKGICENVAFDQIYHEHLLYYNLKPIRHLLSRHDLQMFDCYLTDIHGGSIIGFISHPGVFELTRRYENLLSQEDRADANSFEYYQDFAKRTRQLKEKSVQMLQDAKKQGKRIFGLGAPVKSSTMLHYFDIGSEHIECLVERNPLRKGLFSPGKHIPVLMEEEISESPDVYFVFAWNFKNEILKRNQKLIQEGIQFYFPIDPERNEA